MTARSCVFGSAVVRVVADRPSYADAVVEILRRQRGVPAETPDQPHTFEIFVQDAPSPQPSRHVSPPPDGLVVQMLEAEREIITEALTVRVASARITVHVAQGFSPYAVRVHLTVALYKALLYLGLLRLHAAAVEFSDSVEVFAGGRGAGKTSLSLAFASAGAIILGEDGVVVRRSADQFMVSGADGTLRVLPDTEAHFFSRPLDISPRLFGGLEKKELRVADRFAALPHVDRRVDRLFFTRVGGAFRIERLSQRETVLRLIDAIRDELRFGAGGDSHEILQYLAAFARVVPAFDLELSPQLMDLNRFVEQLAGRPMASALTRS